MPKLYFYTVSPVSISTGERFSPYSDFVVDEDWMYFLCQERIKEAFLQSPDMDNLIEEYVSGVAMGTDSNSKPFELKDFLKNRLKIDFKQYSLRRVPKGASVNVKRKIHVAEIIKNPHFQPYIPGSSLKGAFKGALLYCWLMNDPKGEKWIDEICGKLYAKKEEKYKINENLSKQYESYEMALSDSPPLLSEAVKVYKTIRFHLKDSKKQSGTPQFVEAIQPHIKFEAEYRSEKISLETLLQALSKYSQDANQRDVELLKEYKNTNEKLLNFYTEIADKPKGSEHLFKIGSGKGYFFQSVGLAIFKKKGPDVFRKFVNVKEYLPSAKKVDASTFPITKVVDADTMTPWGWVQISERTIDKEEVVLEKWQKPAAPTPKEVVAEYLKEGTKLKQGLEIDAVVVKSGKPNEVKLMLSKDTEPVFALRGYNSEIPVGTILICRIAQINNKGKILDVSFSKFKN
ncbi:type III-A CRISPR-associated RAMP protein Csm5 [Eisenibacter elegans]|uniref:type III-A CRISPR-associated RAMP protein Csm5 n=1 Tax=Eisenibacter elegans TaxID=997 RepID=UPI00047A5DFC|nr:type III-A CRISPR-associated RAMP protein Csm5 [Eisenibacter elegans]